MSATLRGVEQATDPLLRQAPQGNIGQAIAAGIPGLAQSVQPRQDIYGRVVANPQQGLGALLPSRIGPGTTDPVAVAMARAGVQPSATPTDVPYGPYDQVHLTPQERQAWEHLRGQIIQQSGAAMVANPQFDQDPTGKSQQYSLKLLDQIATNAANLQILSVIGPNPTIEPRPGSLIAPVQGYAPGGLGDQYLTQATQLRTQMQHQALMNALLSGQTGLQELQAANA
jgi:hypothetical protein